MNELRRDHGHRRVVSTWIVAACTILLLGVTATSSSAKTTYYVDYVSGDDSNTGLSPTKVWKTWFNMQGARGSKAAGINYIANFSKV